MSTKRKPGKFLRIKDPHTSILIDRSFCLLRQEHEPDGALCDRCRCPFDPCDCGRPYSTLAVDIKPYRRQVICTKCFLEVNGMQVLPRETQ